MNDTNNLVINNTRQIKMQICQSVNQNNNLSTYPILKKII